MKLTTEKVKESCDVHRNSNTLYEQNQTNFKRRNERRKELKKKQCQCTQYFFGFILHLLAEEILVVINFNQHLQIIMT
jgi:hypothetical protein